MKYSAFSLDKVLSLSAALLLSVPVHAAFAASATWRSNPASGDWNTATNWMPRTVPNGSGDIASFGVTNQPAVSLSASVEVSEITFSSGASVYTLTVPSPVTLNISGTGVTNASGQDQAFVLMTDPSGFLGSIDFLNSATAGIETTYFCDAGQTSGSIGGSVEFFASSNAGSANFVMEGGQVEGSNGGELFFAENSTAANATVINNGGIGDGALGGTVTFANQASAGSGMFTNNGSEDVGRSGGYATFADLSTAANATFIVNGASNVDGIGGNLSFVDNSTADHGTFVTTAGRQTMPDPGSSFLGARPAPDRVTSPVTGGKRTRLSAEATFGFTETRMRIWQVSSVMEEEPEASLAVKSRSTRKRVPKQRISPLKAAPSQARGGPVWNFWTIPRQPTPGSRLAPGPQRMRPKEVPSLLRVLPQQPRPSSPQKMAWASEHRVDRSFSTKTPLAATRRLKSSATPPPISAFIIPPL